MKPRSSIVKRRHGGNERFYLNGAARHQRDTCRILPRRCTGALQTNLACDRRLQAELNGGRDIADQSHSAALPDTVQSSFDRDGGTYALQCRVRTASIGLLKNERDNICVAGVECLGSSKAAGKFQPRVIHIDDEASAGARLAHRLQGEEANRAGAYYDDRIVERDGSKRNCMNSNGDSFNQRRVRVRNLIRKPLRNALRHHNIFGKRPVAAEFAAGDAQHLAVVTKVLLAAETEEAFAAIDSGIKGNPIARAEALDRATSCFDDARRFMAHHDGRNAPPGTAVIAVHIAAANAAGFHPDQQIGRPRVRTFKIDQFKVLVFGK